MATKKDDGFVFFARNESDHPKAPAVKGFVSITTELLEYLNSAEPDERGNYKLQMSAWKTEKGYSGKVEKPYNAKPSTAKKAEAKPKVVRSYNEDDSFF